MAGARFELVHDSFDSDTSVETRDRNWIHEPAAPEWIDEHLTHRMVRRWLVGDRYELEGEISSGGMGRVFRATHRDLGRPFAVKLLIDSQREKPESRERFFTEARLASALCHPNIVSVTDYGVDDEVGCFLVMEMLEGQTVRRRLDDGRLAPRIAFDFIDQLTGAVRYMHARGILHGDIKPENVFIARQEGEPRRRNVVKLLDFGLSFRQKSVPEQKLGGTLPYLAPERLQGAAQSPSCDVYSLGAVLYELLTGKPIYTGTVAQLMDKTLTGALPEPPSAIVADLDSPIDALVMRALARDPRVRHDSAEKFHFELRAVMSMSGVKVRRIARGDSAATRARAAIDAALEAANRGDLARVRAILGQASEGLSTYTHLSAIDDPLDA